VRIPSIIAGGLGPDNGVDSKTGKNDGSHSEDLQKIRRFAAQAKLRQPA
jgi:hypothetical protein